MARSPSLVKSLTQRFARTLPAEWHARLETYVPYAFLALTVLVAYANIYDNAFLYDDETLILHNQFLRHWDSVPLLFQTQVMAGGNVTSIYYRPLQSLLYLITFQIAGLSLFAFHFLNVALHTANACLTYRLGQKLGFKSGAVFLASLLWAVHPLHTEAVTYMSAMADALHVLFILLGVIVLLPDFSPRRIWIAAGLMMLGLLSKESAVTFPLLAASCLYLVSKKRLQFKTYFCLWPLAVMGGIYVVLRLLLPFETAEPSDITPMSQGNYASFAALPVYLRLLLWPAELRFGYELPLYNQIWHPAVLAGLGLIIAAALQVVRRQTPHSLPLSWGILWFVAAHLLTFGIDTLLYEHWMYLPSLGLLLGLAQTSNLQIETLKAPLKRQVYHCTIAAVLCATALLGILTWKQNRIWHDPIAFYENIFRYGGSAAKARVNLGTLYTKRGEYTKAVEQYRLAIANSNDTISMAHNNLAQTLLAMDSRKNAAEALRHLQRALALDPKSVMALNNLADFYAKRGDAKKARHYRNRADAARQAFKTPPQETR
ncbi:MAG: tetratricopeptide repeat protein [Alphaproteobacteria bacterium]|nr:tetratricopeptide repeat protein [Alphaproteobacteria bacterium]